MHESPSSSGPSHHISRSVSLAAMGSNNLNSVFPNDIRHTDSLNMADYFSTLKENDDADDEGIFF